MILSKKNKKIIFLARSAAQRRLRCPMKLILLPLRGRPCQNGFISFGKSLFYFLLLLSTFYFLFSIPVLAQFDLPNLNIVPTLNLTVDPVTPLPYFPVAVTANLSGITNVNNSTYTWFLNGVRQVDASGTNKNTFIFQTGAAGSVYRAEVAIITPSGENYSDALYLTVGDLDLTWSASNEAPSGYRGKIFPTQNSRVVVSSFPFVYRPGTKNLISSSNLIYNWTLDDKFVPEKSGANRSEFVFVATDFAGAAKSVRLEARTADGSISLSKTIFIPVVFPQTLIFSADPKTNAPYGIALRNLIMLGSNSLNFLAQNYFFNAAPNRLKWQWMINGEEVTGATEKPWLAALNLDKAFLPFSNQIQLLVRNPDNAFETAEATVNLNIR